MLLNIPDELLIKICLLLKLYNISKIIPVNRRFNFLLNDDYFLNLWFKPYNHLPKSINIKELIKQNYCWKLDNCRVYVFNYEVYCYKVLKDINGNTYNADDEYHYYTLTTISPFTKLRNKIRIINNFLTGYSNAEFMLCISGANYHPNMRFDLNKENRDRILISNGYFNDNEIFYFLNIQTEKTEMFKDYTIEIDFIDNKLIFENKEENYKQDVPINVNKIWYPFLFVKRGNIVEIK